MLIAGRLFSIMQSVEHLVFKVTIVVQPKSEYSLLYLFVLYFS